MVVIRLRASAKSCVDLRELTYHGVFHGPSLNDLLSLLHHNTQLESVELVLGGPVVPIVLSVGGLE